MCNPSCTSPVWLSKWHGQESSVSTCTDVMQMEGVAGYFDHTSVPGANDLGTVIHDEEVFASSIVTCIGHPIGVIVADTEALARAAARAVIVSYEDIPAVLSIEQAIAAGSFFDVRSRSRALSTWVLCPGPLT